MFSASAQAVTRTNRIIGVTSSVPHDEKEIELIERVPFSRCLVPFCNPGRAEFVWVALQQLAPWGFSTVGVLGHEVLS